MQALVAGAGIGGLTAALCLQRSGWEVEVLEQAQELSELGAGIQLSPNACGVLQALDVLPALQARGFKPQALEMRWGRSGRRIFRIPLDHATEQRWGAPYLHLHRADLQQGLIDALRQRAPASLRTGQRVLRYANRSDGVRVELADGSQREADILIGADGIHSAIREQMQGATPANLTGHVAWRAVVPTPLLGELAPPSTACVWVGAGRHAVTYRLRGGKLCNLVGVVERNDWHKESWSEQGSQADALQDFDGWHPVIRQLLAKAGSHYRWALYDRPVLSQWHDQRVVLMGDACHAMLPFMAQGAAMAIEDAWVLADQLQRHPQPAAAFAAYAQQRQPRCSQIQQSSRANARAFHLPWPAAYLPMRLMAQIWPGFFLRRLDWIYGHKTALLQ